MNRVKIRVRRCCKLQKESHRKELALHVVAGGVILDVDMGAAANSNMESYKIRPSVASTVLVWITENQVVHTKKTSSRLLHRGLGGVVALVEKVVANQGEEE